MSVDLRIPGDPTAIHRVAEWLAPRLSEAVIGAEVQLTSAWADSNSYWIGQSGDAFRAAAGEIRKQTSSAPSFMQDVAEVFRAYANRLTRGQERFDDYLTLAENAGLTVSGYVVSLPISRLQNRPTDTSPARDIEEYEGHLAKTRTYDQISHDFGTWRGDMKSWIVKHMVPLTGRVTEFSSLAKTAKTMAETNGHVVGAAIAFSSDVVKKNLAEHRAAANEMQKSADQFDKQLRSGNPALRAAAAAANPELINDALDIFNEDIEKIEGRGKLIPVVGGMLTVVTAGAELADGGSASSIGAGIIGSAGGAAVGPTVVSTLVPALAATTIGLTAGVGVVAALGGAGAVWLWEAAVPLDAREIIDEALIGPPPVLTVSPRAN